MATNIRVNSYRMDNEGRFHDVECLDRDYAGNIQKLVNETDLPVSENNKTITITENGSVEITPSSGYDNMKKVTATVNVPTTSVTPPSWYTDGEDSVIPADTIVAMANLSEQSAYQTNNFNGDGEKTIAEEALTQGITIDTLVWLWNSNGVLILGYTNE